MRTAKAKHKEITKVDLRRITKLIESYREGTRGVVDIECKESGIRYRDASGVSNWMGFVNEDVEEFPNCCAFDVLNNFPFDKPDRDPWSDWDELPKSPAYYDLLTLWAKYARFANRPLVALNSEQLKAVNALTKSGRFTLVLPKFKNPNSGNFIYLLSTKK